MVEKLKKVSTKVKDKIGDKMDSAADHRMTTVSGLVLGAIGVFLPREVRETCMDAIGQSDSPILTSTLLISGLVLTVIGPSLKAQKGFLWFKRR